MPAAVLAWALSRAIAGRLEGPVVLLVAGGAFVLTYLVVARRLRVREVDELLDTGAPASAAHPARALSAL